MWGPHRGEPCAQGQVVLSVPPCLSISPLSPPAPSPAPRPPCSHPTWGQESRLRAERGGIPGSVVSLGLGFSSGWTAGALRTRQDSALTDTWRCHLMCSRPRPVWPAGRLGLASHLVSALPPGTLGPPPGDLGDNHREQVPRAPGASSVRAGSVGVSEGSLVTLPGRRSRPGPGPPPTAQGAAPCTAPAAGDPPQSHSLSSRERPSLGVLVMPRSASGLNTGEHQTRGQPAS